MKLSFLSMAYSRYSLSKAFSEAERLGMDGIEVWGGRPHAYVYDCDDMMINEINRMSRDTGVPVCAYTPENCVYPYNLCSQSEKERRETVEYYKLALDVAAQIGAKLIQITPGDPGYEGNERDDWRHLVEGMQEVCAHAEKVGVDVVMESLSPYESLIITTADDLQRLINDVPSPRMYGMLDCVNPLVMQESYSNYFEKLGDKMGHIHLTDGNGISHAHMVVGTGEVVFEELLLMIERYKYDRYCSIELGGDSAHGDPEFYMSLSVRRIREMMKRLGIQ